MEIAKKIMARLYLDVDVDQFGLFYRYNNATLRVIPDSLSGYGSDKVAIYCLWGLRFIKLDDFNKLTKKEFDKILHEMTGFSLN